MASHFSTLGFPVKTREDFFDLAIQTAKAGKSIKVAGRGEYIVWSPGEGIQLWAQADPDGRIIGLNPHFNGQALMGVGLTKRVSRTDDTELDGAFYGWASAPTNDPEAGMYPFAFDTPDYLVYDAIQLPTVIGVRLAAFAHEINVYKDENEYYSVSKFAVESCIPSGTFYPKGGAIDPPKAEVIYSGRVLETAMLTNPFTQRSFHWARIRTLGGEVDIIADPDIVKGRIVRDGIVRGTFWLSGRLQTDLQ